jgi:rfaE bifunctional protein kinase chain/domain
LTRSYRMRETRYTPHMSTPMRLLELVEAFETASVVLYGDLVLDRFVLGTPKRISREAPVIILRHEGERDLPGGGANALANLAELGVATTPVGVVGDDEPGGSLIARLVERDIDTSCVVTAEGFRTPTKVRILGGGLSSLKHQVARYDIEDVLPDGGPWRDALATKLDRAIEGAGAVAISDYGYGTVQTEAVEACCGDRSPPPWICVDSRHRIGQLGEVHAATPNLQELEEVAGRQLSDDAEVAAAAEELRQRLGARFVLATRGNRGMTLVEQGERGQHIPVFGTDEVADVTGAGDTVLAVLTAALAVGATPEEAARLANYAGGVVVMKLGTATISRDELRAAIRQDLGGVNR